LATVNKLPVYSCLIVQVSCSLFTRPRLQHTCIPVPGRYTSKLVTGIRKCEEAGSSRSVALKSGKHKIQMTGYIAEQITDERRMSVKTLWADNVAKGQ